MKIKRTRRAWKEPPYYHHWVRRAFFEGRYRSWCSRPEPLQFCTDTTTNAKKKTRRRAKRLLCTTHAGARFAESEQNREVHSLNKNKWVKVVPCPPPPPQTTRERKPVAGGGEKGGGVVVVVFSACASGAPVVMGARGGARGRREYTLAFPIDVCIPTFRREKRSRTHYTYARARCAFSSSARPLSSGGGRERTRSREFWHCVRRRPFLLFFLPLLSARLPSSTQTY